MVRPSAAAAVGASSTNERDRSDEAKYRGVRKRKWGKWVSEIRLPNSRERIWLGSYDSPEKAARAFDAALFCLRGNTANFNFPHQPPNIPGGTDLHPSQIQAVAAHYANSYHHSHDHELQDDDDDDHPLVDNSYYENNNFTSMEVESSSSYSFHMDDHQNTNNIPDFGIFPGFDDYFMQQPAYVSHDYGEELVNSQDPTCLWNF